MLAKKQMVNCHCASLGVSGLVLAQILELGALEGCRSRTLYAALLARKYLAVRVRVK